MHSRILLRKKINKTVFVYSEFNIMVLFLLSPGTYQHITVSYSLTIIHHGDLFICRW